MFRLLLILVVLLLSGCILIPLPDGGPDVQQTALPTLGASTEQIHQSLGTPNLLNSPNYKIYDWETGRRFLIIPAFPTGLPVGGVIAKNRTRLLLALDEQGAVARMECSVAAFNSEQLKTLGCLDPTKQHSGTAQLYERNINKLPELNNSSFYDGSLSGSFLKMVLSPDGRLFAAVDTDLHVWVVHLDNFKVIFDYQAASPGWNTGGRPRLAFSQDSSKLVLSQPDNSTLVFRRDENDFVEESRIEGLEIHDVQFAQDGSLIGLNKDHAIQVSTTGSVIAQSDKEGTISFGPDGPVIKRTVKAAPILSAVLDFSWHIPSQRAVFSAEGRGLVVLDPRNDFARQNGIANFQFSPRSDWLVGNNCQYIALWNSRELVNILADTAQNKPLSPERAMLSPLTSRDKNMPDKCIGPIAFNPNGDMMAAASHQSIQVWAIRPGVSPSISEPISIDLSQSLPWSTDTILAMALTQDNRLVAIFSHFYDIMVTGWQIKEID